MAEVDPALKDKVEALLVDFFTNESSDVIVDLRVAREILVVGGKIPLSFVRRVACETCKGTGRNEGAPMCSTCEGKGRVSRDVTEPGETKPTTYVSTCEACDARGHAAEHSCKECERGLVKRDASVEVDVPAGAAAGMQIRVPNEGHILPGKPQGNLVAVISSELGSGAGEQTPAGAKLPALIAFIVVTILVLVMASMMVR